MFRDRHASPTPAHPESHNELEPLSNNPRFVYCYKLFPTLHATSAQRVGDARRHIDIRPDTEQSARPSEHSRNDVLGADLCSVCPTHHIFQCASTGSNSL